MLSFAADSDLVREFLWIVAWRFSLWYNRETFFPPIISCCKESTFTGKRKVLLVRVFRYIWNSAREIVLVLFFLTNFNKGKVIQLNDFFFFFFCCKGLVFNVVQLLIMLSCGDLKFGCLNICFGYKSRKNWSIVTKFVSEVNNLSLYTENWDR